MSNGCILGRGMGLYLDGITRRGEDGRTRLREQLRGARLAENGWEARQQDDETTRQRDNETTEKHSRSQAFSGILSRARQCEASWRQSGADTTLGEFGSDGLY